jgi:hypothetical protein
MTLALVMWIFKAFVMQQTSDVSYANSSVILVYVKNAVIACISEMEEYSVCDPSNGSKSVTWLLR